MDKFNYRKYITANEVINTEADCLASHIQRPSALDCDPTDFERGQQFYLNGNRLYERNWAFIEDEYSPMFRAGYAAEKYQDSMDG